eukprot:CAMPEP_0169400822 /NCGR_PEP_ID=MMETSP1017-20121227/54106_1 /TAXON_ID=342587 /ORGANISM="Karlodinium micrum, Strain CCMP2283" /LENGTH=56 /DNA_ID=CAMNT_0009506353 /DNA_START=128 /DNA_END=295 /DNA_ORIENTATION=+
MAEKNAWCSIQKPKRQRNSDVLGVSIVQADLSHRSFALKAPLAGKAHTNSTSAKME